MKTYHLKSRDRVLDLSTPQVMGILNTTPDSFSDGGTHNKPEQAFDFAVQMYKDGATIIDIGGESTRPGAPLVSVQEELDRVVPVVEKIAKELDVFISIDTSKPEVMQASIDAGAHLINDIRALKQEGAVEVCAKARVPVCIMHMQGQPQNMQDSPKYKDLLGDVNEFFFERIHECLNHGIKRENIIIDPGLGFGKTLEQNYELLGRLETFKSFDLPILIGLSRKSMIGNLLNVPVNERMVGSVALALYSISKGAHIVRVHDVKETVQALKCWNMAAKFEHSAPKLDKIAPRLDKIFSKSDK